MQLTRRVESGALTHTPQRTFCRAVNSFVGPAQPLGVTPHSLLRIERGSSRTTVGGRSAFARRKDAAGGLPTQSAPPPLGRRGLLLDQNDLRPRQAGLSRLGAQPALDGVDRRLIQPHPPGPARADRRLAGQWPNQHTRRRNVPHRSNWTCPTGRFNPLAKRYSHCHAPPACRSAAR